MLWVGTFSNGLDRFDRTTGVFTHFRRDPTKPNSLSDNLNRFDCATETFKVYSYDATGKTGPTGKGVWSLCIDHESVLWVGAYGGGLNRFDRRSESFTASFLIDHRPSSAEVFVRDLLADVAAFTRAASQSDDITALYVICA